MARDRVRPIEPLRPDEVRNLLEAASQRSVAGLRNRALIAVLYYSGLRLSEVLSLRPQDLDLERGEIHVRCTHGRRSRHVGLNARAKAHLSRWLATRQELGVDGHEPVFCTFSRVAGKRRIQPLCARYVQLMLKRLAARTGLEKRVHPQGLRYSHAVHLLRRGLSLAAIQRQLGHVSLATTDVYLRGLATDEHVQEVRDLDW